LLNVGDSAFQLVGVAARSAPMLALPYTWMPWAIAHRISLCHTAATWSK
jgi:hypothetical protein